MKKKKAGGLAAAKGATRTPSKKRQLVLVDQRPLRHKASSECTREMARLGRAKAEWKRFEVEDKTAFARWSAATFGPLLSRLRETEAALHEKEALMREVDFELLFGGARNPRTAYARVQQRRNDPSPEEESWAGGPPPPKPPWGDEGDGDFDASGDIGEEETLLLFETYLFFELGLDPDRLSDAQYDRMFDEFLSNVLKKKAGPQARSSPEPPLTPQDPPKPGQDRVKELYRLLVRRLHPDTRAESDAGVSALWHEVQDAYSQGNVERLEMLLALTDMQSNAVGEHTSLFQMRAVLAELRRSYNALQKNLRAAKKDPAWNFGRRTDRAPLEKQMRWELESRLAQELADLRHLESLIASWAMPRKKEKKHGKKMPAARRQAEFPF